MLDHSGTLCLKTSTTWARVCDTCRSAPCTIYCRPDAAYLCTACDARIHGANKLQSFRQHERVWVCEACEQAPAAFICKADAASLCTTCDADIHSANPLARRHHRVPVMPIPGSMYGPRVSEPRSVMGLGVESQSGFLSGEDEDESEAASWLVFDGPVVKNNQNGKDNGFLFNGDGGDDDYLEFMEFGGDDQQQCYKVPDQKMYGDADSHVVPVQKNVHDHHFHHHHHHHDFQNHKFQVGVLQEYDASNAAAAAAGGYGYPQLTHSVSMSSLEVGVVPDSTRPDAASVPHPRPSKGTIDLFSNPPVQMATQLTPMDREARVLRYREKKKTRKFEKTIRYASRKAYAETRPRIKGRFAKRTNADVDVDQLFPMIEGEYGIVPSF
ncbi:hypothetical protein E3N88_43484 [Mikania micrantha]|uniref:Uncharacterized protein n=1 Tax=Mikania micrantha TaxID=192012 RepID=A0A5N6LET2_9ASTR|nr:hypothetical protein E3N88_43484 [Mikania micrantha]